MILSRVSRSGQWGGVVFWLDSGPGSGERCAIWSQGDQEQTVSSRGYRGRGLKREAAYAGIEGVLFQVTMGSARLGTMTEATSHEL